MAGFESLLGGGLEALLTGLALKDNLGDIDKDRGQMREDLYGKGGPNFGDGGLMGYIQRQSEFVPSTVASRTGNVGFQNGQLNFNLSPQQQAQATMLQNQANSFYNQAGTMDPTMAAQMQGNFGAADQARQRAMMDPAAREQEVYERIRATQRPEEQRQMEQMNSNLFGSGRGGMQTAAYGGSPEEFAFGKARQVAMNTAAVQSMQQAQAEQMQQGQLANMYGQMGMSALGQGAQYQGLQNQMAGSMFGNQFMPMQQLMAQNAQGLQGGQMYNQSGQAMAGLLAQLGIGEGTTAVNFQNVKGNAFAGLMEALAGAASGVGQSIGDFFNADVE